MIENKYTLFNPYILGDDRGFSIEKYYIDMLNLFNKIDFNYDCIVALKRSGWIMGSYFSNQSSKPVFTPSEIKSIPKKYKNILVVDDKICKGKSISKVVNRLRDNNVKTACIYVQGYIYPDYYSNFLDGRIVNMWYEK